MLCPPLELDEVSKTHLTQAMSKAMVRKMPKNTQPIQATSNRRVWQAFQNKTNPGCVYPWRQAKPPKRAECRLRLRPAGQGRAQLAKAAPRLRPSWPRPRPALSSHRRKCSVLTVGRVQFIQLKMRSFGHRKSRLTLGISVGFARLVETN